MVFFLLNALHNIAPSLMHFSTMITLVAYHLKQTGGVIKITPTKSNQIKSNQVQ